MLLNFKVSNYACYKEAAELSMEAGRERGRSHSLIRIGSKSRPLKVLPIAAIYGNNASGKSQLVQALGLVKNLVIDLYSNTYIPVYPFLLDKDSKKDPVRIELQFVIDENIFDYELSLRLTEICDEKLSVFPNRRNTSDLLFERKGDAIKYICGWGDKSFVDYSKELKVKKTRTFLSISNEFCRDCKPIASVHNWFSNVLQIIYPASHPEGMFDFAESGPNGQKAAEYLDKFDFGIQGFKSVEAKLSDLPNRVQERIKSIIQPGQSVMAWSPAGELFEVKLTGVGEFLTRKLLTVHRDMQGKTIDFLMSMESDGTRRMLDLIPALTGLCSKDVRHVYVVDEIDRSMHHLVTREFLEDFLSTCDENTRSQLIFTTHDLLLMTQSLLRRDEMWLVDKSPEGSASISDVGSFRGIRSDKSILNLYLDKRLGGVPRGSR